MELIETRKVPIERYRTSIPSIDTEKAVVAEQGIKRINLRHGNFNFYGKRFIPEILKNPDVSYKELS